MLLALSNLITLKILFYVVEAVVHLREKMSELSNLIGAKEMDLLFLKTLLEHPQVSALVKVLQIKYRVTLY